MKRYVEQTHNRIMNTEIAERELIAATEKVIRGLLKNKGIYITKRLNRDALENAQSWLSRRDIYSVITTHDNNKHKIVVFEKELPKLIKAYTENKQ